MQRKIKFLFFLIPIIAFVQITKAQNHCTCTDSLHHLYYRHDSLCNGVEKLPWQYQSSTIFYDHIEHDSILDRKDITAVGFMETTYKDGKKIKVVHYFEDNKIASIENYNNNDQFDGLYTKYKQNPNRYKSEELEYKNGKITFTYQKNWDYYGYFIFSFNWIDSSGIITFWWSDNENQKEYEKKMMKGGITVTKWWWKNGALLLEDSLKNHLLINRLACNDTNGVPLNIGTFKNGNGILLRYCGISYEYGDLLFHKLKNVQSSYRYKNGKIEGISVNYYKYPIDTLAIYHYKNDTLNGKYTEYYPDHKIEVTGNYINGKENGITKKYNELGILVKEITYVNGEEVSEKK